MSGNPMDRMTSCLVLGVGLLTSLSGQAKTPSDPLESRKAFASLLKNPKSANPVFLRKQLRRVIDSPSSPVIDRWAAHAVIGVLAFKENNKKEAKSELTLAKVLFPKTGLRQDYWLNAAARMALESFDVSSTSEPMNVTWSLEKGQAILGLDQEKLVALFDEAKKCHSSQLTVWRNGVPLLEAHVGTTQKLIPLASVTKSISSVGLMILLDEGKIKSLDEPLTTFYPEWRKPGKEYVWKGKITLRHILNHTSGIETDYSDGKIPEQVSAVRYALESPVVSEPGTKFSYNNRAANLVSGIVRRLTGKRLQDYVRERVFRPLGITESSWLADPTGNGFVYGGLSLKANDLAKIGQLLLDHGVWQGKRLISANTIDAFTTIPSLKNPTLSHFWWLDVDLKYRINQAQIDQWQREDTHPKALDLLKKELGKVLTVGEIQNIASSGFPSYSAFEVWYGKSNWSFAERIAQLPPNAFDANGSLGQYLVVVPSSHLVAVRLIEFSRWKSNDDSFANFISEIQDLVDPNAKN